MNPLLFTMSFDFKLLNSLNKPVNCKNCQTQFEGLYCPECGQKSTVRRLTIPAVVSDFVLAVTDTERGLLKTMIELSQNPGLMIKNYIQGKRSRYFSAAKYTLLALVVFTVNLSMLENHFGMFKAATQGLQTFSSNFSEKEAENMTVDKDTVKFEIMGKEKTVTKKRLVEFVASMIPVYHQVFFDYLRVFSVLWIPIFSLLSLLLFWKAKVNFAEHFTFNSYVFSHMLLIFVFISPLYWLFPTQTGLTLKCTLAAMAFFLIYSYMQFFKGQGYRVVKTGAIVSSGVLTFASTLVVLMALLAIYVGYQNLDLL